LLRTQRLVSDARRNVRLYTTIKDRKTPLKGSRPSVPHRTNFFIVVPYRNRTGIHTNFGNDSSFVLLLTILKTSIMSHRNLLYFSVGRFNCIRRTL